MYLSEGFLSGLISYQLIYVYIYIIIVYILIKNI